MNSFREVILFGLKECLGFSKWTINYCEVDLLRFKSNKGSTRWGVFQSCMSLSQWSTWLPFACLRHWHAVGIWWSAPLWLNRWNFSMASLTRVVIHFKMQVSKIALFYSGRILSSQLLMATMCVFLLMGKLALEKHIL